MKILYAGEFKKRFYKLPPEIQKVFHQQEAYFRIDWRDARLHTKKLAGEPHDYSFRITRRYRVLFLFIGADKVLFAAIGHRKDVYRRK